MKKYLANVLATLAVAALCAASLLGGANAQVVTRLPAYVDSNVATVYDFGNGPQEFRVLQGSLQMGTSTGSGITSLASTGTTITLTAVPTTAPCVGCVVSGTGIPAASAVTVVTYAGATTMVLSNAVTVATTVTLTWGAACPTTPGTNPVAQLQASANVDTPWYTTARICGWGQYGVGATVLPFLIGAH